MRARRFLNLIVCLAALWPAATGQERELHERLQPSGYVSDYAGVIDPGDRASLESLLGELERKSGSQIGVVTLASLEGNEIRDFTNRLFERWGVGQRGKDNGILIVAAIEDRQIWVEVGYGLEPVIPDSRAGRILDQYVIPHFRAGNYGAGLVAGARQLAGIVAGEAGIELSGGPAAVVSPRELSREDRGIGCFGIIVIILLAILFIRHPFLFLLLLQAGGGRGRSGGGGFGGGGRGGFGGFGGGSSGGGGAGRSW
jgi:uncharacterized protein